MKKCNCENCLKRRAYIKDWSLKHPDYIKQWRKSNPDYEKERAQYKRDWYQANKSKKEISK